MNRGHSGTISLARPSALMPSFSCTGRYSEEAAVASILPPASALMRPEVPPTLAMLMEFGSTPLRLIISRAIRSGVEPGADTPKVLPFSSSHELMSLRT